MEYLVMLQTNKGNVFALDIEFNEELDKGSPSIIAKLAIKHLFDSIPGSYSITRWLVSIPGKV